jgi:lipopolysaccharide biosynthesis protein
MNQIIQNVWLMTVNKSNLMNFMDVHPEFEFCFITHSINSVLLDVIMMDIVKKMNVEKSMKKQELA